MTQVQMRAKRPQWVVAALAAGLMLLPMTGTWADSTSTAADTPKTRETAAQAYLKVQPVSELYEDAVLQMADSVPPEKRNLFIQKMNDAIDLDKLQQLAVQSLMKNFTTDELNYMTEFYGSEKGKAIYNKLPAYLSDVAHGMNSVIKLPPEATQSGTPETSDQSPVGGAKSPPNKQASKAAGKSSGNAKK